MNSVRHWILAVAVVACCASCTEKRPSPQTTRVRLFKTDKVEQAGSTPPGLKATVVWPAVKDLDLLEIAALADPLIDADPQWGSYSGISQQRIGSGEQVIHENHLRVSLTSLESIANLKAFCE